MNVRKHLLLPLAMLIATLTAWGSKPFTAPEVASWKATQGSFPITSATTVTAKGTDPETSRIAALLVKDFHALAGINLTQASKPSKGSIVLQIKPDPKAQPESYTITTTPTSVTVTAPAPTGLYWATRTLLQMAVPQWNQVQETLTLPAGTVKDSPRYAMRGFMIDAGRKYIPLSYLYQLVDVMSYYKLNTLSVHLNDNGFPYYFDDDWDRTQAAFRMESDKFPGLTARDGSYTKSDFRDFIKYAATRGVEIIPEIDVPAHSLAFTRYIPEIASSGANGRDHLDISHPRTYEFLDTLLAEYLGGTDPVFAAPHFNIGTDEYQGDSLAMEQFRAFTDRYIKYVQSFGKQPMVWGSLSHARGKTPVTNENVLMLSWSNGYANPREMLSLGYDLVAIPDGQVYIVPAAGYYQDYLNTEYLYDKWTPANINGIKFTGDTLKHIRGGWFAVWNDHPNNGLTVRDIHHRLMKALPVFAAKTWSADNVTIPYTEYVAQAEALGEAPGINYLSIQGRPGQTVLSLDQVTPSSTLPLSAIGYPYEVEFDIEGAAEQPGTVLFQDPEATLWLTDPITGRMGYSREGHLNTFRFDILPGEKHHVRITGDNEGTRLYVDGHLVDNMDRRWISYNGSKRRMAQVRTLVFPLRETGSFNSTVTNLRVIQSAAK